MNSDRIKEIQETTAYPESVSVKQALLQVWNECEQEQNKIKEATVERSEVCQCNHDWGTYIKICNHCKKEIRQTVAKRMEA